MSAVNLIPGWTTTTNTTVGMTARFSRTEPHERSRAMSMTMEQLQAHPSGQKVLVDGVEWERVDNGLMKDTTVLGLVHFTGYVNEGRVEAARAWPEGRWYAYGRSLRMVTKHEGDTVEAIGWDGAGAGPIFTSWPESTQPGRWQAVSPTNENEWMPRVRALHRAMTDLAAASTVVPEALKAALQQFAADANDTDFDDLLAEFGIGRTTVNHVSKVTLHGESSWVPTHEQAKGWLGTGFEVMSVEEWARVNWRRTVLVTQPGRGCMCNDIDEAMLEQYLPTVGSEDWDFDIECEVQSTE